MNAQAGGQVAKTWACPQCDNRDGDTLVNSLRQGNLQCKRCGKQYARPDGAIQWSELPNDLRDVA